MSKYHSIRTLYNGEWYDSKREANYAKQLDLLRRAVLEDERVISVERQPGCLLVEGSKGVRPVTYRADFKITYANNRVEIVDVKGFQTAVFKLKLKLMKSKYPDIAIKLV